MFSAPPTLPQWTDLGQQLSGPDRKYKRADVMARLQILEDRAKASLYSPNCEEPARLEALTRAISHARTIAEKVFQPVDLSAL